MEEPTLLRPGLHGLLLRSVSAARHWPGVWRRTACQRQLTCGRGPIDAGRVRLRLCTSARIYSATTFRSRPGPAHGPAAMPAVIEVTLADASLVQPWCSQWRRPHSLQLPTPIAPARWECTASRSSARHCLLWPRSCLTTQSQAITARPPLDPLHPPLHVIPLPPRTACRLLHSPVICIVLVGENPTHHAALRLCPVHPQAPRCLQSGPQPQD